MKDSHTIGTVGTVGTVSGLTLNYHYVDPVRRTNSMRLRSLPDEELFGVMGEKSLCKYIQGNVPGWCEAHGVCQDCIKEYLEAPVEGEK